MREIQTKAFFRLHRTLVRLGIIRNANKGLARKTSQQGRTLAVPFPAPIWGGSHWPVIPFPGDPMSSFGLHGHLHLLAHTLTQTHTHTCKYK